MIFPNPYMTGRSGYKNMDGKRQKARRTEKIGIEKLETAEKRLKARIKAYKKQLIINTPIEIDFTKENLNKAIAEIRKKYKVHKMTISKVFGGVRSKRKHATYHIDLKEKTYQMEIDEFGSFGFSLYNSYPLAISKKLNSVQEMINALDTILTGTFSYPIHETVIERLFKDISLKELEKKIDEIDHLYISIPLIVKTVHRAEIKDTLTNLPIQNIIASIPI